MVGVSFVSLMALVVGGAVVVAVLVGVAALLANPRTRAVGVGLMLIPVPIVVLGVLWHGLRSNVREEEQVAQRAQEADRQHWAAMAATSSAGAQVTQERPATPDAAGKAAVPPKAADAPPSRSAAASPGAAGPVSPAWVAQGPRRAGGSYQIPVATDPYESRLECEAHLPEALHKAVGEYIEKVYLPQEPEAAARVRLPLDFIRTSLVKEEWEEPFEASVGPMVRLHALVQFDHAANVRIDEAWQQSVVGRRLWLLGAAFGGLLWALSVVWGYLKIDLATNGAYRWRLRFLAALAILAVVAAGVAVVG